MAICVGVIVQGNYAQSTQILNPIKNFKHVYIELPVWMHAGSLESTKEA